MSKILAALALVIAAALTPFAFMPAPANAAWGTDVGHAADDDGWNDPIHVMCVDGRHWWLAPGEWTFREKPCSYSGVQSIIVPAGHTVYCKNSLPPYQNRYFYVGGTEVPSSASLKCYDQKAL